MVLPPRTVSTSDSGRAAQHHGQRPRRFSTADSSRPRTAAEAAAGRGPSLHNAAGRGGGQGASAARTDGHTHTHTRAHTQSNTAATTLCPAATEAGRARKVIEVCPAGRPAKCS